jgi:heat-inducible transcriptional repressor
MTLSQRELTVLREVIRRHLRRGAPVSSAEVARSSSVTLSSATVRSVMAQLEEKGLLRQPHTSAGRVPTDLGLRANVDAPASLCNLSGSRRRWLAGAMNERRRQLAEGLDWVTGLIADATQEAGIAVRPMGEAPVLEAVSLLPLPGGGALGVVVTAAGTVEKRVVELSEPLSEAHLLELANFFNATFHGWSLDAIIDLLDAMGSTGTDELPAQAASAVSSVGYQLFRFRPDDAEVLLTGTQKLLEEQEYAATDTVRTVLAVLEDRARIARFMRRFLEGRGTGVVIGQESELTAQAGLGMVATVFLREGRRVGAVGVLGPRRMDYARILPVVEFVGETLTAMLDESVQSQDAGAHYA